MTDRGSPFHEKTSERPDDRKKTCTLGVVGMIYEARPNVTVDAFGLCFKTGNAVILKGGSDAIHSNIAIVSVIQKTLEQLGIPKEAASLIEDTSRDTAAAFMKMTSMSMC